MKWQHRLAIGAFSVTLVPPAFAAPQPVADRVAISSPAPILLAQADQQQPNEEKERHGAEHGQPQQRAPQQRPPQHREPQRQAPQMQRQAPQHREMQRQPPQRPEMQRQEMQHREMQRQTPQRQEMQRRMPQRQLSAQHNQRFNWNEYRPGQRPPDWQAHRNFDRGQWTRNYYAQRQYHWRPYVYPRGWFARHWAFGMILPRLFWAQQYWITDYWDFGLPNPPYGYVWVRYDNDALLVDVETGGVLQAIYGLFN